MHAGTFVSGPRDFEGRSQTLLLMRWFIITSKHSLTPTRSSLLSFAWIELVPNHAHMIRKRVHMLQYCLKPMRCQHRYQTDNNSIDPLHESATLSTSAVQGLAAGRPGIADTQSHFAACPR